MGGGGHEEYERTAEERAREISTRSTWVAAGSGFFFFFLFFFFFFRLQALHPSDATRAFNK